MHKFALAIFELVKTIGTGVQLFVSFALIISNGYHLPSKSYALHITIRYWVLAQQDAISG